MKITQEVRDYAAKLEVDEKAVIEKGFNDKSKEFIERSGRIT